MTRNLTTAVFAGGCFWCTEAVFNRLKGVSSAEPGYAGGSVIDPSYEQVSSGKTGHAECIKIEYDPEVIGYDDLLTVFFATHDPTQLNRQGNDVGTQYRSVIFYTNHDQQREALSMIKKLSEEQVYGNDIVTTVEPFTKFYPAEDYHLNYYERNQNQPYCQVVINPKLHKLKERFASLLQNN